MTGSSETPDVRLPSWPFKGRNAVAALLYGQVFGKWLSEAMDDEVRLAVFDDLCRVMEFTTKKAKAAASDTLAQYAGCRVDEELNRLLCMQFAWNVDHIKAGHALCKFTCVTEFRWLPFQIGDVQPDKRFGRDVAKLSLLCIGGFAAGYVTVKVVPWNFLRFFAYKLGFNRRWIYDDNHRHFLGLRFAGLIEPSDAADLLFHRYHLTASMKKHNMNYVKDRAIDAWEEARLR